MLLTASFAITATVALIYYAVSRGRSPLSWGGTSILIDMVSMLVAVTLIRAIGDTDMMFTQQGTVLGLLVVTAGPIVSIVGNYMLYARLAALPMLRTLSDSSWRMWKLGENGGEGCECQLSARPDAIVGMHGADGLFAIPRAELTAIETDGESLVLRSNDGRQIKLLLMDGDPDDRNGRIAEINTVKRALIRSAASTDAR